MVKLILFWLRQHITWKWLMLLLGKFSVTDTRLYLPNVTSLTQDNAKLLNRLKSGFKGTVNWNKYQSKAAI